MDDRANAPNVVGPKVTKEHNFQNVARPSALKALLDRAKNCEHQSSSRGSNGGGLLPSRNHSVSSTTSTSSRSAADALSPEFSGTSAGGTESEEDLTAMSMSMLSLDSAATEDAANDQINPLGRVVLSQAKVGGTTDDPTLSFRIKHFEADDEDDQESAAPHVRNSSYRSTCEVIPTVPTIPSDIEKSALSLQDPSLPTPSASTIDSTPPSERPQRVSLENFELLKVIGRGAFGKVFLVKKKNTSKFYAMKVLRKASIILHTKTAEHTQNERSILERIQHPFIVKLWYAFQTPHKLYLILGLYHYLTSSLPYLTVECIGYAPGGELFTHLANERMFSEDVAAFYIGELLLALEHLHSLGIIYRDLKPENVLLDKDGHILLTDFGLSKVALSTQTLCGTIEFTAPEVLEGNSDYGRAVDFWSLGFSGNNRKKVMEAIMKKKLTYPNYLSSFAKEILTKLLKKNPQQRLGYVNGASDIKKHGFFRKINWKLLASREVEPPIIPSVIEPEDTSNFHDAFTNEPVIDSPPPGGISLSTMEPKPAITVSEVPISPITPLVSSKADGKQHTSINPSNLSVTVSNINCPPAPPGHKRRNDSAESFDVGPGMPQHFHGFSFVADEGIWDGREDVEK
ncbi:serine/threonine protein kinase psk1 [Chytridiales sp. JEL 0842]|nr:serine/threonine protein kinase psk1 [Chytridiales sp. JEL 0842]